MRTKTTALLSFLLSLSALAGFGQDDPFIRSIKTRFEIHGKRALQEKIFLHTDRTFYLVGETIWFKAYNLDGTTHRFLDMSKVAYLEVLDKENVPVFHTKFSMLNGKGNGALLVPSTIASGSYKVRCYTNWMKNFSADYFFESNISIVNPFVKFDPEPDKEKEVAYDLQFFPEGGDLVRNIESKVAFRAVDQNGKGVNFRGLLIDAQNDTLVRFQPDRFGIGHFLFKPQDAISPKVILIDEKGKQHVYQLPQIRERGFVMRVTDSTANLVKVTVTGIDENRTPLYMLCHTRQANQIGTKALLINNRAEFMIDRSKLGEGISHITIFNEKFKPVCERLYFKRPGSLLEIEAKVGKPDFGTREKVTMDFVATTGTGATEVSNLSVSVFLSDSIDALPQSNIASYLLLTSELKGNIEDPDYYFENVNDKTDRELDNLMISQGWRRFNWDEVLANKDPDYPHIPEYDGHLVFGKVLKTSDNSPAVGIDTYMAPLDFPAKLYVNQSDRNGNVMFELKGFTGTKEVTIQTNLSRDSIYKFEIESPFSKHFSQSGIPAFFFNKNLEEQLLTRSINMQTGNAFIPKVFTERKPVLTDSLAFFGVPDEKYFLDDFTRFPTMEEVLREYVRGVMVRRRQKEFHFRMIDKLLPSTYYTTDPLVLLDGIPLFNIHKFMETDPLKIKKVELMNSRYFLGSFSFTGIVSFSSYKNDLAGFELDPKVLVLSYEGVQAEREFYMPKYDNQLSLASRIPDFRNLLHWAPEVITDAKGKAQIQFFTSDQVGNYKVVVQGINAKGVPGSGTASFSVGKRSL